MVVNTAARQICLFSPPPGEDWTAWPPCGWVAPFYRVLANELGIEVTGHLNANRDFWISPLPLAQHPSHIREGGCFVSLGFGIRKEPPW